MLNRIFFIHSFFLLGNNNSGTDPDSSVEFESQSVLGREKKKRRNQSEGSVSREEKEKRGNESESSVDERDSQPVSREPRETDTCEIIGPTMEVQSGMTILKNILELIV